MRKIKIGILSVLTGLMMTFLAAGCSGGGEQAAISTGIDKNELDPAVWGETYPVEYQSYLKNNEQSKTEFGGSEKESKFISEPEIKELFKGYGFSKDYNEDRGHTFAMEDLLSSGRIGDQTPGSCLTCKTPAVPKLMKDLGDSYYTTSLKDLAKDVKHAIACSDCHDPANMDIRVTRPAFTEAMKKQGVDINKASKQDMRTYVCAQCHVEYYFEKDTNVVTYPWDNGMEPEQIEKYYDSFNFSDWQHPDSEAPMRKTQHPEFETWSTGVHGTAGVSCADCHMPYMREDGKKYSSHWWTSPLKTIEVSCQTCHDQDAEWLKERVLNTQERTQETQERTSKVIVRAHRAIKAAIAEPGAERSKIREAQEMVSRAQWYWDWVAAENSRGFHNPVQALDSLGQAADYGYQAIELAEGSY